MWCRRWRDVIDKWRKNSRSSGKIKINVMTMLIWWCASWCFQRFAYSTLNVYTPNQQDIFQIVKNCILRFFYIFLFHSVWFSTNPCVLCQYTLFMYGWCDDNIILYFTASKKIYPSIIHPKSILLGWKMERESTSHHHLIWEKEWRNVRT